jgi:hypothetical protein
MAQQADSVGLSDFPVPAWPAKGVALADLNGKYVYVDLAKNEYVVTYPENLGTDAFAQTPGPLRTNRYELLRNVTPTVSVAVTPVGPRYRYAFTVENGPSAKQSIDQFIMVLPEKHGTSGLKGPAGWHSLIQRGRTFKLRNPEWISNGAAAIWSFQKNDQVIQPGSSKTGFEIESEFRPGFTVAYLRKAESVDVKVATQGNVPKDVKDQMDLLLSLEFNSRTVLVIGPKFDGTVTDHTIAADFIQGIFTLARSGVLELNSEFVRSTLNELTGIQPVGSASGIKLAVAPRSAAEIQIASALKASLRLN